MRNDTPPHNPVCKSAVFVLCVDTPARGWEWCASVGDATMCTRTNPACNRHAHHQCMHQHARCAHGNSLVVSISHTGEHFAALKTDGNVATFPLCNGKDLPDFGNLASPCGTTESHFTESYVKIASELVGITRIEANGGAHPSGQRPHAHKN